MPSALVPKKFKAGKLHSGSKHGPIVTDPAQMKAIFLSERRNERETGSPDRHPKPTRRRA
jgi:hypothetical protein